MSKAREGSFVYKPGVGDVAGGSSGVNYGDYTSGKVTGSDGSYTSRPSSSSSSSNSYTGDTGKKYTVSSNGTITVVRPDGTTSTVKPGDANYSVTQNAMNQDVGQNWQGSGGMVSQNQGSAWVSTGSGSNVLVDMSKVQYGYNLKPNGQKELVMITPGGQRIPMNEGNKQFFPSDQSYGGTGNFYYNEYLNPTTGKFESGAVTGGQGYGKDDYYGMMGIAPGATVNGQVWRPGDNYQGIVLPDYKPGGGNITGNNNNSVDMTKPNGQYSPEYNNNYDYAATQKNNTGVSPSALNSGYQGIDAQKSVQRTVSSHNNSLFGGRSVASI